MIQSFSASFLDKTKPGWAESGEYEEIHLGNGCYAYALKNPDSESKFAVKVDLSIPQEWRDTDERHKKMIDDYLAKSAAQQEAQV